MRKSIALCLVGLAACSGGGSMMTMGSFYEIPVGTAAPDIVAAAGQPYAIHKQEDGSVEYEYVERFKVGGRNTEERHYFLLIKDGKVASKRVKQSSPPPYIFDSYEMQTTDTTPPG